MKNWSHRPSMSLHSYYINCACCCFKDMKKECERAQKLKGMGCFHK